MALTTGLSHSIVINIDSQT